MKSRLFIIPILSLTFLISGCGSDSQIDKTTTESATQQTTETTTEQTTEGTTVEITTEIETTANEAGIVTIEQTTDEKVNAENMENHKQMLKNLYDELITECDSQTNSYNELEFSKFLANWSRKRNDIQKIFDDENANADLSIALTDLVFLRTELKYKVTGQKYDENYIEITTKSIEALIQ